MLSHDQVWQAIDALAQRYGLSSSGLARRAGLDPTTFNRSKRAAADGRLRWPSTESIAKILDATGANMADFLDLISRDADGAKAAAQHKPAPRARRPAPSVVAPRSSGIPLIGMAQAGQGGFYDDGGYPVGSGFDDVVFPQPGEGNLYGLRVSGDSMLPLYRDGDVIVVDPAASVHKGDRVVARTREGEVLAKELAARTTRVVRLRSLNPEHPDREFQISELDWIARIVWASQ